MGEAEGTEAQRHEEEQKLGDVMAVGFGIIGCGDVTEVKSGPAIQRAVGAELVAVMRRTPGLASDYARRHGVPRSYEDADQLIADPAVDVVYVATPPGSHLEYALKVAAAGKSCYMEKPMARNYRECGEMISAFEARGLPLWVAYYRRGFDRFRWVKSLLDGGRLGRVTSVCVRYSKPWSGSLAGEWRVDAEHSGGGLFLDVGSHTLDLLDFLVGPLHVVGGAATNRSGLYDVEDSATLLFRTADGALGTGMWNFVGVRGFDQIEIEGEQGRVAFSTFGHEPITLHTRDRDETRTFDTPPHVHQPLVQTIVDELNGKGKSPSTGRSAARTSGVMDAVLTDYYGGRSDAFWDRPERWPRT